MVKSLTLILLAVLLISGISSCKKLFGDEVNTYHGGKVILINSDTPVPNVLVRFLRYTDDDLLGANTYEEVGTSMTDENGKFEIPLGMNADVARAYGPTDLFENPSIDAGMSGYDNNGNEVRIALIPPAWIRLQAIDVEPLNPEIIEIQAGTPNMEVLVADGVDIWKCDGNFSFHLNYHTINTSFEFGPWLVLDIPGATPFDTTTYTIEY